jgi:hypothetical protein
VAHALIEKLVERTAPVRQATRGPAYNHPMQWYAKPNGDVVLLQADPQNRAYYEDKGYALLRHEERQEWLEEVRPLVLREQFDKARVLTTIRRVATKHPGVEVVGDLEDMDTDELRGLLADLGKATGAPLHVITGRIADPVTEPDDTFGAMVGAGDELQAKIERQATEGKRR